MAKREVNDKKDPKVETVVAATPTKSEVGVVELDREIINVGAAPNDGTGDPIRDAMVKINENFQELYKDARTTNVNASYVWTNTHTFLANVDIKGNSYSNVQFVTDPDTEEMDVRFNSRRVYFGGGAPGLEGAELNLGFKADTPDSPKGNWTIDVFGFNDEKFNFKNAFRIYQYDSKKTPHPFLYVSPQEGGDYSNYCNAIFSFSYIPELAGRDIPFSVTFAKDIGPWDTNVTNIGSSTYRWNSIFVNSLFDRLNSPGKPGQVLSSTSQGLEWIAAGPGSGSYSLITQSFVGDGSNKTFNITGGYTPNQLNVFLNGVRLTGGNEIDISSGTSVVFKEAPQNGIPIDVVGYLSITTTIDTTKSYAWTANQIFNANIEVQAIRAGGSVGTAGQVLTSDGTKAYWGTGGGGGGGVDPTKPNTWTAEQTFNANIVATAIKAGGTLGTSGQVLSSTGSGVAWTTAGSFPGAGANYTWTGTHTFNNVVDTTNLLKVKAISADNSVGAPGLTLLSDGAKNFWGPPTATIPTKFISTPYTVSAADSGYGLRVENASQGGGIITIPVGLPEGTVFNIYNADAQTGSNLKIRTPAIFELSPQVVYINEFVLNVVGFVTLWSQDAGNKYTVIEQEGIPFAERPREYVQLGADSKLPAMDGSKLYNLSSAASFYTTWIDISGTARDNPSIFTKSYTSSTPSRGEVIANYGGLEAGRSFLYEMRILPSSAFTCKTWLQRSDDDAFFYLNGAIIYRTNNGGRRNNVEINWNFVAGQTNLIQIVHNNSGAYNCDLIFFADFFASKQASFVAP